VSAVDGCWRPILKFLPTLCGLNKINSTQCLADRRDVGSTDSAQLPYCPCGRPGDATPTYVVERRWYSLPADASGPPELWRRVAWAQEAKSTGQAPRAADAENRPIKKVGDADQPLGHVMAYLVCGRGFDGSGSNPVRRSCLFGRILSVGRTASPGDAEGGYGRRWGLGR